MKKLLMIAAILFAGLNTNAQVDIQQMTELAKSYTQVGDTVGIYAKTVNGYELMEPLKFKGVKSNALGSALSYGIAKTKMKTEYSGETSPYVFTGKATFRIYFGLVPTNKVQKLYMFSASSSSIRDVSVAKFQVKKNKRQLTQGNYSLWTGSQTGLQTDHDVKIDATKLRENVYDVEITAEPGEYCFVINSNGMGGYMPVFDFTIKKD